MDDTISTHKKERGKGCVRKDFDDLGSMDKNTYMQHGSLGHDVISLLVFGGYFGVFFFCWSGTNSGDICMFLYSLIDEREISKNLYAVGLPDRLINIQ